MALDHAGTPAQLPAVGVAECDVEVVVLDFEDEGELVECEVLVVVGGGGGGADAPPVSAFFAATSYRPFATRHQKKRSSHINTTQNRITPKKKKEHTPYA